MENLDVDLTNQFRFNFELLIVNGKSLRFSLDGYKLPYSMGITKLIDTFGGELTEPDFPGTIVLSNSNQSSDPSNTRYHVKFLYDSIVAQKLQNLENYRITSQVDREQQVPAAKRRRDDVRSSQQMFSNRSNEGYAENHTEFDESSSNEEYDSDVVVKRSKSTKTLMMSYRPCRSAPQLSFTSSNHNSFATTGDKVMAPCGRSAPQRVELPDEHLQVMDSARKSQLEFTNSKIQTSSFQNMERDCSKETHRRISSSEDDESLTVVTTAQVHEQSEINGNSEDPECLSSPEENELAGAELQADEKFYLHVSPSNSEPEGNEISYEAGSSHQAGEEKSESYAQKIFSEDVELRMFQYLIDNKLVSRGRDPEIWKKFLETEMPENCELTASRLAKHFHFHLRFKCQKFTNDPDILRLCDKRRQKNRWTEAQNKAMIDFVINNRCIHRVLGSSVWEECLKATPLLRKAKRTSAALRRRFREYLRDNYDWYTNDPEVLKQFKAMQANKQ